MAQLKVVNKMTRTFGKMGLKLKKHSPEILVVTGVIGVVASAVLACKATTKATAIIEQDKKDTEAIKQWENHRELVPVDYNNEDAKKDIAIVHAKTSLKIAKTYAPAVILGGLSITCILASNNILRKRNVALAAAYTTLDNSFKGYRQRVIERFGEELDRELKYNIKTKEVEEKVVDEKGKEKTVKKTIDTVDPKGEIGSPYAFFFDNGCLGWQKDAEHNKWYVLQQQNYANEKLKANGYLFLNDVYDMFGVPRTKAGQIVGWIYNEKNPNGDNRVDFGLFDNIHSAPKRDFVNGYERTVLLDPNVDGPILDLI